MTTDEPIELALYEFLKERSAQMGESFTKEQFLGMKKEAPDCYNEELVQMKCAIRAIAPHIRAEALREAADVCVGIAREWDSTAEIPSGKAHIAADCAAAIQALANESAPDGGGWLPIAEAKENTAYLVMYAQANPPSYDMAVLYDDEGSRLWMNCVPGWLRTMPCILDYIDSVETPTHFMELPAPPRNDEKGEG